MARTQKGDGIVTAVETITPEIAKKYLAKSKGNRNISKAAVASLVETIRHGGWFVTHQGIGFNVKDNLIDGHTRLTAIIEANAPVDVMVTRGLSMKCIDVTDTGTSRSVAHILQMGYGEENSKRKQALATSLHKLEHCKGTKLTVDRYREIVKRHQKGWDWLVDTFGIASGQKSNLTADALSALVYAYPVSPDKVMRFATALRSFDAAHHSSVRACINTLSRLRATRRPTIREIAFNVLRCLLAYIHHEQLVKVQGSIDGYERFRTARHKAGLSTVYRDDDAKYGLRTEAPIHDGGAKVPIQKARGRGASKAQMELPLDLQ